MENTNINENDVSTQVELIKCHLQAGKKITSLEALNKFGCMRLSSRIWDLKQEGLPINKEMISNGKKKFAQYSLNTKSNAE